MNQWQKSEHSFLIKFSDFQEHQTCYQYKWPEGKDWPKFNFIRLKDSEGLDPKELSTILEANLREGLPTNIKLGLDAPIPLALKPLSIEFGGTPISFLSTDASDFNQMICTNTAAIEEVKNTVFFEEWWLVNSGGRARQDPFESPIWKKLVDSVSHQDRYFLLKSPVGENIACFSLTQFDKTDYNLWGVSIDKNFQGKGYLSSIYSFIANNYTGKIYGQINLDSRTLFKRLKLNSTIVHTTEKKYLIKI